MLKTLFLLREMNVQEVKIQKISPAARYIKESMYKSIDSHLSKSESSLCVLSARRAGKFLGCFSRPKGGKKFGREKCIYMEKSNKKTLECLLSNQ